MPEQISSYRLEQEIARGGMGVVYRAVHTVFDEVVAIKAIFPELTLNPELRERFLNEAKIQRRLRHPNIVQIRECLIDGGKFHIVMEYIEGETLTHHLRRLGRPMSPNEAIDVFCQALQGLGFAHSQGVIHRDIKPSNIMLTRDGVAKLTDFGIARALGSAKLTRTGTAVGTPAYMSPEQILGAKVDRRSDIYSMGVTLYEMLTGRVPFERARESDSDFAVLEAHIKQVPARPSHWIPEIPVFLEGSVLKALAKRPEERFASCQEFQAALVPVAPSRTRKVSVALEAKAAAADGSVPVPVVGRPRPEPVLQPKRLPPLPPPRMGTAQAPQNAQARIARLVVAGLLLIAATLAWVHWPRPTPAPVAPSPPQEQMSTPANPEPPVQAPTVIAESNPPTPAANPAQIVVQTAAFAQVYLDDRFEGQASRQGRVVIDNPIPGEHNLRVSLAGKRDYEQRVLVAAGQTALFEVALADAEQPPSPAPVETPRAPVTSPHAGPVRENPRDGLKYVWIRPGTFGMGCSAVDYECSQAEKPAHQVTITKGFWIGQTPVTAGAYQRFAGATARRTPPPPRFNPGWTNQNMPVVNVTWSEAQDYCEWIGMRLPTEAEWEYAARGGSSEARYGNPDEVAWYNANSDRQTHEVAQKRPNGFGLYDVLGNVWEWVSDWYDEHYYQTSPEQDPGGPEYGQFRIMRGGSWSSYPRILRFAYRSRVYPNVRITDIGFRCGGQVGGR